MPKTYDKKAWLEQKELTKEENLKIIQNIVNNFKEDPEKILEFIDFQSRFYNYSTRNTMLIYAQNPGALFVGSFAAIKKITDELAKEHKLPNGELPYYGIKKGAKAIKIFVPQKITYLKNESGDWIQLSKADKQMQLEYKKGNIESYQRLGFGIGSVFDISQTNLPIELYPTVISEGFGEESEIHKQFAEYLANIAVMSLESVQIKIEKLMDLLTAFPNIQIFCTDGCECFDNNKIFISTRIDDEENNAVRELLTKDLEHMESIQSELSNSRQFYLVYRFRNQSKDLVGTIVSRLEKCMSEYDFVCKRLEKSDLKQFLAVYFGISSYGAEIADVEGATNENM